MSEEAVREYEALQQKYELEKQCRSGAELFATEVEFQYHLMTKIIPQIVFEMRFTHWNHLTKIFVFSYGA